MTPKPSNKRLYWLLAVHVVLAATPLLLLVLPFELIFLPFIWAFFFGVPIGSLMTLSVWVGMGSARIGWRLLGGVAAIAYVALLLSIVNVLQMFRYVADYDLIDGLKEYLTIAVAYSIVVLLFGGMFGLIGRRFKLRRVEPQAVQPDRERFQFSVLHVLLIMSVVAVVLTLLRASRDDMDSGTSGPFRWSASESLAFIVFLLNTLCAAFATLWPTGVKRNVGLMMLVAGLLGIVLTFTMGHDQSEWWLFVGGMLMAIVPTVVEVASLLVVRSCGYRMMRRCRRSEVTSNLLHQMQ